MQSCAVKIGFICVLAAALAGCGSSSSGKTAATVSQVILRPATISLVAGQVVQVSASALTSTGAAVSPLPTFTFNSTNTSVITVSPGGLVCGGVWDSFFITCNGSNASGNPVAGTALITASAQGVSSAPTQVSVHAVVTSIIVDGPAAGTCFSVKQTFTFKAHACSTQVLPHDASGPCSPNSTEITNQIGSFTWTETAPGVAAVDSNGVATAGAPGQTGVIASVGSVASPFVNFRSCMPVQITLHINGDPPGQPTESTSLAVAGTATIEADMVDENNVTTNSAPVLIVSANTEVALLSGVTLTGESPGGAGLLAACIPPTCGAGLNIPIYSNLFSVSVTGSSPTTVVYATSSFAPPSGTTPTIIPIDTSKNPIVAGTAINLPGVPNSLVFNSAGSKGYMGTSAGIASLDTAAGTVSLLDPFVGKVLAVAPDGNTVILSNAANDPGTGTPIEPLVPSQRLVILSVSNNTVQSFVLPGAVAAAFTGDSFKAFIAANNGNVYVFSPFLTLQTISIGGANVGAATVASGPFAYLVNGGASLAVLGTCNNALQGLSPPATSTPQLVGSIGNINAIVAVNSTGVDIETAAITPLTAPLTLSAANCTPNVSYSNQFIDFGLGAFTARQLLVPTNSAGHIVVLPAGINQVLVAVPGTPGAINIPLPAGATEALSGGMTLDGNTAWVGVGGTNTVDQINLTSNSDVTQIATSFKKSDGTAAPPNIVAVKPR